MKNNGRIWENKTVRGETVLFVGDEPAQLCFAPEKILRIYNSATGFEYSVSDIVFSPGSKMLKIASRSAIVPLPETKLYPERENAVLPPAPNPDALKGGPNGKPIFFDEKNFFARHQFEIDYTTKDDFPAFPRLSPEKLPRFRNGKDLKIAFVGDSITQGYNASGFMNVAPFAPSYAGQIAEALRQGGKAGEVRNFAAAGTGCRHGVEHIAEYLSDFTPDLLFIAYGMNDLTKLSPDQFRSGIKEIIRKAGEKNPRMEFILIGSMPGNPAWKFTPPEATANLAAELQKIAADDPAIAAIDVGAQWSRVFVNKKFADLTGNGVNHPNDFGHKFYAFVILENII